MCPSDSNGVYSLPDGYTAVTGEIIQASQHNPPLEDLASAMSQRLLRTGVAPMTGPLKIADGSVGSPGLKFNSDGTSGFYKTANGIGVSVSGTKVAEFTSSGASRMIGELIAWTLLSAPAGWVLPYGQTLSRTTYADLWTIAQDEIAGGNAFYNNGNGTTTFGIGDMRGRVPAGKDNMGGSAATRLTSMSPDANTLGAVGGTEYSNIPQAALPNVAPTFTGSTTNITATSTVSNVITANVTSNNQFFQAGGSFSTAALSAGSAASSTIFSTASFFPNGVVGSINGGQTQAPTKFVQPTLICNYLLFAGA